MSGAIQDIPLHVCRACLTTWMADDHMYEEPDRCPKCGRSVAENEIREKGEDDGESC